MSEDLVSRQAVIDLLRKWADGYCYIETPTEKAVEEVESLPSAETPGHGRWTIVDYYAGTYRYRCSICGANHRARYDYCPSCGARMDGEENEQGHK